MPCPLAMTLLSKNREYNSTMKSIERISAVDGVIQVYSPQNILWYEVTTAKATRNDYSWMLKNRPARAPFEVTDENISSFRELAV